MDPNYAVKLWIFISFLPNKLGNNDRIAGQNLPNINGQDYNLYT